jgi:hypothetical protein
MLVKYGAPRTNRVRIITTRWHLVLCSEMARWTWHAAAYYQWFICSWLPTIPADSQSAHFPSLLLLTVDSVPNNQCERQTNPFDRFEFVMRFSLLTSHFLSLSCGFSVADFIEVYKFCERQSTPSRRAVLGRTAVRLADLRCHGWQIICPPLMNKNRTSAKCFGSSQDMVDQRSRRSGENGDRAVTHRQKIDLWFILS